VVKSVLGDLLRALAGRELPPPRAPAPRWRRLAGWARPLGVFAAVGMIAAATAYMQDTRGSSWPEAVLVGVMSVVPAALSWRWPLRSWGVAFVALFLGPIGQLPDETWAWNPVQILGTLIVLFVVAYRAPLAVTAWVTLLSLIPPFVFMADANRWGAALLFVAVAVLGEEIGRRRQTQRALAEQEELSELERARRAVLEERTRIARELHDVVAHHMSMIAVRAETAPFRVKALPDPARTEFAEIASAARGALTDMRRLLGVLRSEASAPDLAPQPGLDEVTELVELARQSGLAVHLRADDAGDAPPDGVALAAYRIVQEALANAARHAPGAAVEVELRPGPDALVVRVSNATPPPGAAPGGPAAKAPAGHGLTGMRERAATLGGALTAAPTEGGGFEVTAHLPYATEADP
jgi:signal transduction histidine kinase